MRYAYLFLVLLLLSGCEGASPKLAPSETRSDFAQQIARANRVTINEDTNMFPEAADLSISLTGAKVREIVDAVSAAIDGGEARCHCAYSVELHFWNGHKHLEMVQFTGSSVQVDGIQYWDKSGIFEQLEKQKVLPMEEQITRQVYSNFARTNRSLH